MAKFTLNIYTDEDGQGLIAEKIGNVAYQQQMDADGLRDFISGHVDPQYVVLQFDTEANTCTLVPFGEKGVDDWDRMRATKTETDWRKKQAGEKAELQRQIDEAVAAIDAETDKQTVYVLGLLKFIEDNRERIAAINGFVAEADEESSFFDEDEEEDEKPAGYYDGYGK
jgi:hypothetical protein